MEIGKYSIVEHNASIKINSSTIKKILNLQQTPSILTETTVLRLNKTT
jgi:hypothetical protein